MNFVLDHLYKFGKLFDRHIHIAENGAEQARSYDSAGMDRHRSDATVGMLQPDVAASRSFVTKPERSNALTSSLPFSRGRRLIP